MVRNEDEGRIVYSSQFGRMCPECAKPIAKCTCKKAKPPAPAPKSAPALPNDGVVRVFRETKGRKGKGVCLIRGLGLPSEQLETLAKELKKKCGAGGTCADGVIEIQGDHRDFLVEELIRLGYKAKKAGG